MQKTKRFRLLTVLLAVVMMFALSIQAYAATSKPVTQDGLTATLVTDKDSYKAGESVNATVKIENNSGQDVFVFTQITVPSTVKLTGASAFDAVLANGQAWTSAAGVLSGTAGTTATGDNMQAGVWTVVSILAIGSVAALLVYGKNRKTWVSMMLCVVMMGGLMAAAVPAQAAGVSGSMSLVCPIQIDGKAAEVTAVVNYIVGYEAGSVTTTTTPSETPSVAPTTVPSEDPTTVPTEDPTEAPTTVPTEDPTEAPTETPTEAPTTAPTETPTEAPTTVPSEEPSVAPTAVPTEEPVEDEVPSENGYYVVWDDFNFCEINSYTDGMFTSWDVVQPQGAPNKAGDGASFVDASEYAGAQARRAFNAIADDFTMEFTMRMSAGMEDTVIDLRNEDTTAIRFTVEGDKLLVDGEELCALPVDVLKTFTLHISPANGTYTISVDGTTVMDGDAAKEFTFENSTDAIDRLYIETGVEEMGQVVIGTVRVYVDFYVNEKFLDGTNLAINDEWTITGDAATIYKKGTQGPDKYNALLSDGDSISRDVAYEQDGAWVEFQQLMEENVGEFVMTLADDAGNTFKVATKDGKFGYYNGTEFVGLYDCVANLWYHVMIKQTDAGTELYLNHKLKADELPNIKFTKMTFEAIGGEAMLDDVIVKDWIPLPDDYVPEPVAVEKEEGATLVGLQSCNLWVEGEHFGYDWLTDWEERTPILGYYDEISTESADWELKFKIEHGIDFELYCWYRPTDGAGQPIKMARNSKALHEGYMNAEYSNQMQFAITWESGSGGQDLADFKENIVPYWIEQYFKDDRYMVIDNKPFVGMYNINQLKNYFGGIAGVKEALDYLRQACTAVGFDGAYIIMSNSSASSAQEIAQAGFDGQYAYTWGATSNVVSSQTKGMESVQHMLVAAGQGANGVVPTVSQGFWDKAWNRADGNYASVETFQEVLRWVKEDFMPNLDQNSIGSKVVLLDNWNEYGEGHFIMPANLAGFGYLDAVKTVFGDGEACDEAVQHVEPTQAQLDRINHMYIQDRHVVKVDKDSAASNVVPMEGYNWTFDAPDDTEGWEVGFNDGRWIKELKDWAVKDGKFWGLTFTPDELAAKQTNGDFGTLTGAATADPSLMSPDLGLNASEAIAIKVRMRGEGGIEDVGKPGIYFITEADQTWSGTKVVTSFYEEGNDGYAEIIFDMTTNALWTGTIKQLRFDPINRDGEFWVDSIQILKVREGGDAEVYLNGNKVYTTESVVEVDGEYMFPVDEIDTMIDATVKESLEKDRLFISTETAFYEFPYEGDTKMLVNGVAVDSVGVSTINDILYLPIVDFFENSGTIKENGTTHPAYTVTVTPATADEKAKIEIEQYVAAPRVIIEENAYTVYDWDFSKSIKPWCGGGTTGNKYNADMGALKVTCASQASGSSVSYRMNVWSSNATGGVFDNPINLTGADMTHVLVRVAGDEDISEIALDVQYLGADGKKDGEILYSNIPYQVDENGDLYAIFDLSSNENYDASKPVARIGIWPVGRNITADYDGQVVNITSVEILDMNWDITEESYYFTEENSWKVWLQGGTTVLSGEEQCLVVAPPTAANDYNPRLWSKNSTTTAVTDPYEYTTDDVTHIRVRMKAVIPEKLPNTLTDEEKAALSEITTEDLKLNIQYTDRSGLVSATLPYEFGTEDFQTLTFDISDMIAEGKTIGRIGLEPFDGGNELLCKAGAYVMVDSVQFMKRPSAEDEGSDTPVTPEEPEVPGEEGTIIKAFYFDTGVESWSPGGIATTYADGMICMDFTTQHSNPAGCGWKSPENKLAIDPAEISIIRATVKVENATPKTAKLECFSGGFKYDSSYKGEITASYKLVSGNTYVVEFDCTKLADKYAADELLNSIRINGMTTVEDSAKGQYYLDSVEFIQIAEEDKVEEVIGDDAGKWAEGDATYASLIKGWYFNTASEAWLLGGAGTTVACNNGSLVVSGGGTAVAGAWTSYNSKEGVVSEQTGEMIKAKEADTLRIRMKSEASDVAVTVFYYDAAGDKAINKSYASNKITWTTDNNGWSVGTIDLSADNECYAEGYIIGRVGCNPNGQSTELAKTGTAYIDYVELLKKAEAVEEPEVPMTVAYEWTFDANLQGWACNSTNSIKFVNEDPHYAKLVYKEGATAAQFWTPNVKDANNAGLYPSIDITTVGKIELRVKSLTTEAQTLTLGAYDYTSGSSVPLATITTEEMGTDWTVITVDAADINWASETGTLQRFYVKPSNASGVTGDLMAIDYLKIYTTITE